MSVRWMPMLLLWLSLLVIPYVSAASPEKHREVPRYELPAVVKGAHRRVIQHLGYTVGYNTQWKVPDWVAYALTKEETQGTEARAKDFVPDPALKAWETAETTDYTRSGYDRGHMAPAADMKWSVTAMKESFYLSNVCPQNHNLNGGDWKALEDKVRTWAEAYGVVYIACGPLLAQHPATIGWNKVAVPEAFYKVLLLSYGSTWQAIAFLFPNKSGHKPLSAYARSVDDIELLTGFDFFTALPNCIENKVEAAYDFSFWFGE